MRFALLLCLPALVQDPAPIRHGKSCPSDCPPCGAALRRGLEYLRKNVGLMPDNTGTPIKPSVQALAGLAFLGSRDTQYGDDALRCFKAVKAYSENARIDAEQSVWPVAFAGWLAAELARRGRKDPALAGAIVRFLERTQQPDGGWGHDAAPARPARGYPKTLLVTTNAAATALALLKPEGPSTERARRHYESAQLPERRGVPGGGFPYDATQNAGGEAGRTAGACWALRAMGEKAIRGRAEAFLLANLPKLPEGHASSCLHVFSGGVACCLMGGDAWKRYNELFRDRILKAQRPDGSFKCICSGDVFCCDERKAEMLERGGLGSNSTRLYISVLFTLVLELDRLEILKEPACRKAPPDPGPDTPTGR